VATPELVTATIGDFLGEVEQSSTP
jgi:hypothetical protein